MRWLGTLVLVLSLSVWSMGCGGQKGIRVQNPAPIAAAANLELTEQAILDTLPRRGWTAESVEPGRVIAFLPVRTHLLRVEIRYDADRVTVHYVDSSNLNEERDGDEIYVHKKVNGWMKNLAQDLSMALADARAAAVGAP